MTIKNFLILFWRSTYVCLWDLILKYNIVFLILSTDAAPPFTLCLKRSVFGGISLRKPSLLWLVGCLSLLFLVDCTVNVLCQTSCQAGVMEIWYVRIYDHKPTHVQQTNLKNRGASLTQSFMSGVGYIKCSVTVAGNPALLLPIVILAEATV